MNAGQVSPQNHAASSLGCKSLSYAWSVLISQTSCRVVTKVPSETQRDRGTGFVILGLSLLICEMARLDKMLSEGLSAFSLSCTACLGLRGLILMPVHRADPTLDSARGHWPGARCMPWWGGFGSRQIWPQTLAWLFFGCLALGRSPLYMAGSQFPSHPQSGAIIPFPPPSLYLV